MERLKVKAKTKTKITPKDLIEFCSKEVHNETVFEKINHIYDELNIFIDRNKLVMNNDEEAFMIQLINFVYKNSSYK